MKVWNTSGEEQRVKAGGKEYIFKPFEEKEIHREEHALHINDSFKYLGLIALPYTEGEQKEYPNYIDYKAAREIVALKATLEHFEKILASEINAEEAAKKTAGAEHELRTFKVDYFENKVKKIKQYLKEAGYDAQVKVEKKKEEEVKRPDWRKEIKDVNPATA